MMLLAPRYSPRGFRLLSVLTKVNWRGECEQYKLRMGGRRLPGKPRHCAEAWPAKQPRGRERPNGSGPRGARARA